MKEQHELDATAKRSVARKFGEKVCNLYTSRDVISTGDYEIVTISGGNWNYRVEMTAGGRVKKCERSS